MMKKVLCILVALLMIVTMAPTAVLAEEGQPAVDAGTVVLVGTDSTRIVKEVFRLLDDNKAYERMSHAHNPYGDGLASRRIASIIRGE